MIFGIVVAALLLALVAHEVRARRAFRRQMAGLKRRARLAVACMQWPDLVECITHESR
jgi:hypothetical protein